MKLRWFLLLTLVTCSGDFYEEEFGAHSYTDSMGFDIRLNGYPVGRVPLQDYELLVMEEWQAALGNAGVDCHVHKKLNEYGPLVSWQPYPFVVAGHLYAGATTFKGYGIQFRVGYRPVLADSALGHEMGHGILYVCGLNPDETNLMGWATRYNLPY